MEKNQSYNTKTIFRGFKVRLYPTKEQETLFYKHIDSCRYVWNYMLNLQIINRGLENPYITGFSMITYLSKIKHDEDKTWLSDVSSHSLNIICQDLDTAFKNFFKKDSNARFPKFKKKKNEKFRFPIRSESVYFDKGFVNIEKIGKVKYKSDRLLPQTRGVCKFINSRIKLINKKWILTFAMECDKQTPQQPLAGNMGIDLGIRRLATVSYLDSQSFILNINKSQRVKKLRQKLKYLQHKLSNAYKVHGDYSNSNNIMKIKKHIRRIYFKLHNIIMDYIHKETRKLVNMCPYKVIMEDINIESLLKHTYKNIKSEILYSCWYEFRRIMKYKCEEMGIIFILADKHFPSTQICHKCSTLKTGDDRLKLKDKLFICKNKKCNMICDRDINAAINLEWYGNFS